MKKKGAAFIILVAAIAAGGLYLLGTIPASQPENATEHLKIIEPPDTNTTKYTGVWLPFLREVTIALDDSANLRSDGVTIVAIGVKICKNNEFYVCENETAIQRSINEFHKKGIKTFLILNPAHPYSGIDPQSSELAGTAFLDKLTPLVLKWSAIAEKQGVELFSPVNEPQLLSHNNKGAVSSWAQEILPKIREQYAGKIVFEVQGTENTYDLTGYDYVAYGGFTCTKDINERPEWIKKLVVKEITELQKKYPNQKYLLFGAGGFTGPDYYWWEPIAPENMKNNPQKWPKDFFTLAPKEQANCYEIIFDNTWDNTHGYFLPVYKGWEYRNKPAEKIIRKWFNNAQ